MKVETKEEDEQEADRRGRLWLERDNAENWTTNRYTNSRTPS
jgi:hypothetical protein